MKIIKRLAGVCYLIISVCLCSVPFFLVTIFYGIDHANNFADKVIGDVFNYFMDDK